jgi:hypothetical protein
MKTKLMISALVLLWASICTANADDNKYAEAMAKNIQTVYTSKSLVDLQGAVNTLERIAATEKTKWEPYYYAAFGYIMMANLEQQGDKKDAYLDKANAIINNAKAVDDKNSEIIALEGFVHMIRVTVDPATRGQQYSGLAMQTFGKALNLNPENPRALALLAQMQFGTAQFLGSSTADACSVNESAIQKFTTFKSDNPFAPQWGKEIAELLKSKCK